jgi:hypothetical protein
MDIILLCGGFVLKILIQNSGCGKAFNVMSAIIMYTLLAVGLLTRSESELGVIRHILID